MSRLPSADGLDHSISELRRIFVKEEGSRPNRAEAVGSERREQLIGLSDKPDARYADW